MTPKKKEDIAIGQRIKDIRAMLGMDQKTFASSIGSTVSALSNWENGRNKPNDIKLREIAKIAGVSTRYILTGTDNEKTKLEAEINFLSKNLNQANEEIKTLKLIISKLEDESLQSNSTNFADTYLSELLSISKPSKPISELYETVIEDYQKKLLTTTSHRDLLQFELEKVQQVFEIIDNDENYYSPQDRVNPDFESHGKSQFKVSEFLQGLPYFLDYENTMKVVEYAELLMEKEENRFKP